jgi:hypothetical protein
MSQFGRAKFPLELETIIASIGEGNLKGAISIFGWQSLI